MNQELFESSYAPIGAGERELISISNGGINLHGTPAIASSSLPPLASSDSSSSATTILSGSVTKTAASATDPSNYASEGQNLRCPRCDSSNTKFCYYNNYNLTQPRHFCKTCRRYWTKGGALRNVPIGGGCRKNKTSVVASAVAKSGATKFRSTLASEGFMGGLDRELPSNPAFWALPHSSHLLALLRGSPVNPNPNPSPLMKEEVNMPGECQMSSHGTALDLQNQGPCSSLWSNSQQQLPLQLEPANYHQSHQKGYMLDVARNDDTIQALYQRLKLSTGEYSSERSSAVPPLPTSTSLVLESVPSGVGGDQLGYWRNNLNLCWSDIPTSNGAYP